MKLLEHNWTRAWRGVGAQGDGHALRNALLAAYTQPQRHYHTLQHLAECLQAFEAVRALSPQPAEIAMALWFHDAVYAVHRADNEARSAEWARSALLEAGVPLPTAERVFALVMATRHDAAPVDPQAQLLVDVDLAILGAPPTRFAQYEAQIRQEYAFVPEALFRSRRRDILHAFLERPHIYSTAHFRATLEATARANLHRALGQPGA